MSESKISNANFPDEIICDVLSRLPVKSLLQFRSVSKHWRSLITDTHFIKSHLKKAESISSHHRILVPVSPILSLDYNVSPYSISSSTELDCKFIKPWNSGKLLGSCNGLVCLIDGRKDISIYNPSTRRHFKPLQSSQQAVRHSPNESYQTEFVYGFGCSSNSIGPRVFRFPRFARDSESLVYDFIDTVGTFLNGSLHWLARYSNNDGEHRVIALFNISQDTLSDLSLPPHRPHQPVLPYYALGVLKGCLFALCDGINHTGIEVWLMKEYGVVNSWSMFIKIPLDNGIGYMRPLSCVNDDEIVLEIDLQSYAIYNAKTKTLEHVKSVHNLKWFGDAAVYVESLLSPEVSCVLY
uniref:F-box/kelch-repeat protein At3g23880-like n=1 Tax=Erigeron canadensis TaxID=72917 RepID=UPI001CB8B3EA|nr:F-box/kelch-repeat protein At3g23880-like [Erigeron canadensis]XP_043615395.1 F-box/kelch-repeat protein At3g23880-like [Erigeron canadensis]